MTDLKTAQQQQGASLAGDGIPLHFGDVTAEYKAATTKAALLDRSHEGRIRITGKDRMEIMHRISTNDLHNIATGEGRGTVFTKANARIIDRVMVYNRGEEALLITEPGRGGAVANFLQRQIFFNDDAQLQDITGQTQQFTLHGPHADDAIAALGIEPGTTAQIEGVGVFVARRRPLLAPYWTVTVFDVARAGEVWLALSQLEGVTPAGSLAYNMLRVQSGRPAFGRELSTDYNPLEVGLWDEVSFTKGCYTGQEIIARMESRNQMAKVMVRLRLDTETEAPTKLMQAGKAVGTLTSSAKAGDGSVYGVGVVKVAAAQPDVTLETEGGTPAHIIELAGTPPPERMLS